MAIFNRRPWYKRLKSLRVLQPLRAIEVTDEGLRLLYGGAWEMARWGEISNPVLHRTSYMARFARYGGGKPKTLRVFSPTEAEKLADIRRTEPPLPSSSPENAISDILIFTTPKRTITLDISVLTPHFENDLELRSILLAKLCPRIENSSSLRSMFLVIVMTLLVVIPLLYFSKNIFF